MTVAGTDRGVPGPPAGHRRHAGGHPVRGQHAAAAGAGALRADRLRRLPEGGGRQPDRLVQGPRDDRGGLQGGRGGRQGGHLRLHRQHLRLGRRVRRPGRADLRGAGAAGQDRAGQAGAGAGARRPAAAGRPATSTTAWRWPAKLSQDYPVALVNSVNPDRLEGQKTAAFEIVDGARRRARHPLPAGRQRRQHHRLLDGLPARTTTAGNATRLPADVRLPGRRRGADRDGEVVREPRTIATAIRIGNPASWAKAVDARDESGGLIDAVTDRQILAAYRLLAREVGVFVELASAASVAGLLQAADAGPGAEGVHGGVHGDRARPEGPGLGDLHRAGAGHHRGRSAGRRPGARPRLTCGAGCAVLHTDDVRGWREAGRCRTVPSAFRSLPDTGISVACSSPSWSCSARTGSP